MPLSDH